MSGLFAILMAIGCTSSPPTGPQSTQDDVTDNGPTPTEPGTPGQVTDLVVTDSTGTAVTLSFTQVDDGAGDPADYQVRTHVGPMNWGTAEDVSQGTCAAPVQGTAVGSTMSCTIEGLLPDVAYTFQVAAFRGVFQVNATFGDLSNVVPDMNDHSAPPNDGSRPNEPSGLLVFAEHDFSCRPGDGCATAGVWKESSDEWKQRNQALESDRDAPQSSDDVFRYRFPANVDDGVSSSAFYAWDEAGMLGEATYSEVYVSFWVKIKNADFENQTVGTKLFGYMAYGKTDRRNQFFLMMRNGTGAKAVQSSWDFRADFTAEYGAPDYDPNQGQYKLFTAGRWHHIEMYHKLSGDRTHDGVFKMWIDGALYMDHRNVNHLDSTIGATKGFYQLHWVPVWGGHSGDVRSRDDDVLIDHIYMSGKRQ